MVTSGMWWFKIPIWYFLCYWLLCYWLLCYWLLCYWLLCYWLLCYWLLCYWLSYRFARPPTSPRRRVHYLLKLGTWASCTFI
jgi:hypothetical protein